ncbi:MAG: rod shape-determining protein MreD [Bacteroidetes bacterium]|nr:rod shape-determining protein MreD [Bacteroidota bacterium]
MINQIPVILFRLLLLLLVQVILFSNMNLSSLVIPYVFPLFVLLLPFETPRWLLMLLGFISGLTLDIFLGSTGMHAAAGVLIGYLRPFLINAITPKGTEFEISPNIYAQGVTWFVFYLGISMFLYLFFYFLVEAATFLNFFLQMLKIILSTVASVFFMLIFLFLFSARRKRRFV